METERKQCNKKKGLAKVREKGLIRERDWQRGKKNKGRGALQRVGAAECWNLLG